MEEQKLKERINSNSFQPKTTKLSCTGYTGESASVHPKATSKKPQCHRLHRCPVIEHRSIHHVILQRACFRAWEVLFSTGYTGGLILDHRCIHSGIDQRLCSGSEGNSSAPVTPVPYLSRHRCIAVRLSLIQMSTATIWIQCDRIHRCYGFGLSGACDFCGVCSQWIGVPLHSI